MIPFGIFYSLIIGVVMSLVGAGIGTITSVIIKNTKTNNITRKGALVSLLVLFVVAVILAFSIFSLILKIKGEYKTEYEKANQFGIKVGSNIISRISLNETKLINYNFTFNSKHYLFPLYEDHDNESFVWNDKKYIIGFNSNIYLIDSEGHYFINYQKNSKYPYINSISYISYKGHLLLLVDLRATSGRSLLLIFNEAGENIYEELIEDMNLMETAKIETGEEVIALARGESREEGEIFFHDYIYKIN
jgi:hypothetical protein